LVAAIEWSVHFGTGRIIMAWSLISANVHRRHVIDLIHFANVLRRRWSARNAVVIITSITVQKCSAISASDMVIWQTGVLRFVAKYVVIKRISLTLDSKDSIRKK
tara:strand:- start:1745 stop:2059 length:315 start_codon:yes stop_codon:yes gene_type:complete